MPRGGRASSWYSGGGLPGVPPDSSAGGTPAWVPAGARIHIDLVGGTPQGRAWVDGTGEVAVDTLLGSDPNTESGWNVTFYDPAYLMSDGYYGDGVVLVTAFIGAARSKVLTGGTTVVRFRDPLSCLTHSVFALVSADGNNGLEIELRGNQSQRVNANSWNGSLDLTIQNILNTLADGAINVLAFTLTQTRIDFAVNGSDAVTSPLTVDDYPVDGDGALVAVVIDQRQNCEAIQSITIYDQLSTIAGLSELSETGVANTAPHDIVPTWNGDITSGVEADQSVAQSVVSPILPDGAFTLLQASVTDDAGNPITWTMIDASSPLAFSDSSTVVFFDNFGGVDPLVIDTGVYSFTLRATDHGGLYAEQTFTLTVAAV